MDSSLKKNCEASSKLSSGNRRKLGDQSPPFGKGFALNQFSHTRRAFLSKVGMDAYLQQNSNDFTSWSQSGEQRRQTEEYSGSPYTLGRETERLYFFFVCETGSHYVLLVVLRPEWL